MLKEGELYKRKDGVIVSIKEVRLSRNAAPGREIAYGSDGFWRYASDDLLFNKEKLKGKHIAWPHERNRDSIEHLSLITDPITPLSIDLNKKVLSKQLPLF